MAATEEAKKPRKEPVHKHPPYVEVGSHSQSLLTATQAAKDSALSSGFYGWGGPHRELTHGARRIWTSTTPLTA